MVFAGRVLDTVQHWPAFLDFPELFILVPALLGLKGNLEMTLASRLSTAANMGELSAWYKARKAALCNVALVQLQGIVVGGLAALVPIAGSYAQNKYVRCLTPRQAGPANNVRVIGEDRGGL